MEDRPGLVGELRHGILGVVDALAQSVALLSLALGVAFASSAAVGVCAILLLARVILFKGGDSGLSLQPLNPAKATSTSNLFLAVVLTFTGFIGFEAAAVLGEEAADPLRAIPKAILTAVLVALVYYVFVTWAMAVGFGVDNAPAWARDPAALDTLATRYVGNW